MKRQKTSNGQKALTAVMGLYALVCLLPVLLVFIASISDDASLTQKGFSFFPTAFSTKGWDYVFNFGSQLLRSYEVTIFITVVGTALSLIVMSMYAYVLSKKEFMLRRFFTVLLIITMLFDGGQVSKYIIFSSVYKMKDTIWVLILPTCVSAMNVIIIRSYIQSNIPDSLAEAALIDGAGEFRCFWQVIFPMMKPSLAAVGFMRAVAIWNEWQNAYLFITDDNLAPLQLLLIHIEKSIEYALHNSSEFTPQEFAELLRNLPQESCRMAMLFMVLGPILIAYPFFQKYFVKGLTVGAVKG